MSLAPLQNTESTVGAAAKILAALDQRQSISPLTEQDGSFGLEDAYRVAAEIRRLREVRGERLVGRKIGFTNTTIWRQYNVAAPIWGYVYDTTLHSLADVTGSVALAPFVEPRIEPEIVFGLARAPEPGMDEWALLACIEWVALGFEIVQSHFPGWRFRAPDTVAAFGLHGALYVGGPTSVTPGNTAEWYAALSRFEVQLRRDDQTIETGRASNVLERGPLVALRYLVEVLADDPGNPPLAAGEVISTGTLTNAYPIKVRESWNAVVGGLLLPSVWVSF